MTTHIGTNRGDSTGLGASDAFLRFALKLDAVVTGLNGLAYLAAASVLDDLFDISAGLLRESELFSSSSESPCGPPAAGPR